MDVTNTNVGKIRTVQEVVNGREVPYMSELFDITKFDSYKEDNRREVKKSQGWASRFLMGNIFCNVEHLLWYYYSLHKRTR